MIKGFQTILNNFGWSDKLHGFYIPHRYAAETLNQPARTNEWVYDLLESRSADFFTVIESAARYNQDFKAIDARDHSDPNAPRFNQSWFCGLDAILAYTVVRTMKPSKIIEVGSGHSTRFLYRALLDEKLPNCLTSIDPAPRKDIDRICAKVYRETVFNVSREVFLALEENDVLFLDGSHVLMPGTDVDYLFNTIFPVLKKGVLIHVHDIFLPDHYPQAWNWRSYNEQYALASLLVGGNNFEVFFPVYFMKKYHPACVEPLHYVEPTEGYESSFWMRKVN